MKCLLVLCTLLLSMSVHARDSKLTSLSAFQWLNRIVVVNRIEQTPPVGSIFQQYRHELSERDVIWFIIDESDQVVSDYTGNLSHDTLRNALQQYAVKPGEVILIGKDGGLKLRLDNLDIPILFSVIDAMPMRQNEMQRQRNEYDF